MDYSRGDLLLARPDRPCELVDDDDASVARHLVVVDETEQNLHHASLFPQRDGVASFVKCRDAELRTSDTVQVSAKCNRRRQKIGARLLQFRLLFRLKAFPFRQGFLVPQSQFGVDTGSAVIVLSASRL